MVIYVLAERFLAVLETISNTLLVLIECSLKLCAQGHLYLLEHTHTNLIITIYRQKL